MIGDQRMLEEGLTAKSKRKVLEKLTEYMKKNLIIKANQLSSIMR